MTIHDCKLPMIHVTCSNNLFLSIWNEGNGLRYQLATFNPQMGRHWEASLDCLLVSNTKAIPALKFGAMLVKNGRYSLTLIISHHPFHHKV
jgi:hypothetical protein